MQPIQIRMNAAVVLIVLLLAVPLQLFLSHYLQQVYLESTLLDHDASEKAAGGLDRDGQILVTDQDSRKNVDNDLDRMRADAMESLGVSLKHVAKNVRETIHYYSSWEHFKELFVIPYKRPQREDDEEMIHITRNENGEFIVTKRKSTQSKSKTKEKLKTKSIQSSKSNKDSSTLSSSTTTTTTSSKSTGTSKTELGGAQESKSTVSKTQTKLKEVVEPGTSYAKEVAEYLFKEVYFTHSKTPRISKPSHIKLSVGQVVEHVNKNFIGVIVGWDEVAKAPENWIKRHYSNRQEVVKTPHYLVLLDTHFDASGIPLHYIPQEDLELVQGNVQIRAPELSEYFEGFKNHRHIPRPWLKERYPED